MQRLLPKRERFTRLTERDVLKKPEAIFAEKRETLANRTNSRCKHTCYVALGYARSDVTVIYAEILAVIKIHNSNLKKY